MEVLVHDVEGIRSPYLTALWLGEIGQANVGQACHSPTALTTDQFTRASVNYLEVVNPSPTITSEMMKVKHHRFGKH